MFEKGSTPFSDGLAMGDDGALYGTCIDGGKLAAPTSTSGMGTVFRVAP